MQLPSPFTIAGFCLQLNPSFSYWLSILSYELMLGHKAKIPCDPWLGFPNCKDHRSNSLLKNHYALVNVDNQRVLKRIKNYTMASSQFSQG